MCRAFILFLLLPLAGCLPNNGLGSGSAAQINIYRLHQICLGMSEEEVFQIMHYPEIDEQIFVKDACYDIWFYVTRTTALGQTGLRPHNLTPLIFKDGVLIEKGYDYYLYLRKQAKKEESQPPVSIWNRPAQAEKKKDDPPPQKPVTPDKKEPEPDKKYRWDEEDDRMLEQEQEQNFDYW